MGAAKTALITGATSGIGKVIAKHLADEGYDIIVLARSENKMAALSRELNMIDPNINVKGVLCDFSSLESTREACRSIADKHDRIDMMLLNAGLWNSEKRKTADNIEETWQVNVISQIQVFQELKSLIPNDGNSKVIITSSALHQGEINFADLEFEQKFSGFKAYRQSKLALMMLARWMAKQEEYEGIEFYSVHPGMVNTNLGRDASWFARTIFKLLGKSPEKGARSHIHVVDAETDSLTNGEYYANGKVTKTTPYSYNLDEAEKLWNAVMRYL